MPLRDVGPMNGTIAASAASSGATSCGASACACGAPGGRGVGWSLVKGFCRVVVETDSLSGGVEVWRCGGVDTIQVGAKGGSVAAEPRKHTRHRLEAARRRLLVSAPHHATPFATAAKCRATRRRAACGMRRVGLRRRRRPSHDTTRLQCLPDQRHAAVEARGRACVGRRAALEQRLDERDAVGGLGARPRLERELHERHGLARRRVERRVGIDGLAAASPPASPAPPDPREEETQASAARRAQRQRAQRAARERAQTDRRAGARERTRCGRAAGA